MAFVQHCLRFLFERVPVPIDSRRRVNFNAGNHRKIDMDGFSTTRRQKQPSETLPTRYQISKKKVNITMNNMYYMLNIINIDYSHMAISHLQDSKKDRRTIYLRSRKSLMRETEIARESPYGTHKEADSLF